MMKITTQMFIVTRCLERVWGEEDNLIIQIKCDGADFEQQVWSTQNTVIFSFVVSKGC